MNQGSAEWHESRLGKATASRIKDILATLKGKGEAAGRRNYRAELVVERLTGEPTETFCSFDMQRGIDLEPDARNAYQFLTDNEVEEVGFIDHPEIPMAGASPDGLIGEDGLVEIKCPKTATHIDWILADAIPAEHVPQMLWQMDVTGRKWCDFVSFDPRMPLHRRLFVKRLERDEDKIKEMREAVIKFLAEVDETVARLAEFEAA